VELLNKNQNNLGGVRYTMEWRLPGVSYTSGYVFRCVRYTAEAIAKQMKATTALKGTILQKIDQKCAPFNQHDFIFKIVLVKSKIVLENL